MTRYLSLLLVCLLAAAPAHAKDPNYSQDASQALTTSYSVSTLAADGGSSRALGQRVRLGLAQCVLTSISSAASITWFVALDSAGEEAITPEQTDTIVDHDSDGSGTVSRSLDVPVVSTAGAIYIVAKTDAGTATAECRIFWE